MERRIDIRCLQRNIAATLHYAPFDRTDRTVRLPLVVFCHDFASNRIGEHRLYVKAARAFAEEGYAALRFDYAGCGESEGEYGESGLEDWIEQTRLVLDYVLDLDFIDLQRVTLLGHGLGGAVALLTAARDKRVKTLALWAPSGHPFPDVVGIVGKAAYEEAVTAGVAEYAGYRLRRTFFESLARLQPFQEARAFEGDVLLVHGAADSAMSVEYSFLYQKVFRTRSAGSCDKEIYTQADHSFSTKGHSDLAIRRTTEWLRELGQQKREWYGWII